MNNPKAELAICAGIMEALMEKDIMSRNELKLYEETLARIKKAEASLDSWASNCDTYCDGGVDSRDSY